MNKLKHIKTFDQLNEQEDFLSEEKSIQDKIREDLRLAFSGSWEDMGSSDGIMGKIGQHLYSIVPIRKIESEFEKVIQPEDLIEAERIWNEHRSEYNNDFEVFAGNDEDYFEFQDKIFNKVFMKMKKEHV